MKKHLRRESCPICGSSCDLGAPFAARGPWKYLQCGQCGATSLDPLPGEDDLKAYYSELYTVPIVAYARGTMRNAVPILRMLGGRLPQKGRLLEIGSSYGFFLDAARRDGWETAAIELDDRAATYGRENLGLKTYRGTLESEFDRLEPPYDAIATFHVIEHVRDPIDFLLRCRKLLREEGVLVLKTPNVSSWIAKRTGPYWQWLSPPAHIHLFSPPALALALEKCGFRAEQVSSQRGDAHSNLFELACAMARYVGSKRSAQAQNGNLREKKSWSDTWHVNMARALGDIVYYPLSLTIDPWMGKKGLQPELMAIAQPLSLGR
jgi:2-polyprenyl-3-methyl-5-hydroxy-6-metoxy-1,4-benzoquinol methylase